MSARTLSLLFLLVFAVVGCSSNDANPTGPTSPDPEPEEEIRTPTQLRITKITIDRFDEDKDTGPWDLGVSVASRRPDVYVTVRTGSSSAAPIFRSVTFENAFSGAFYDASESGAGTGLPKTVSAGRKLYLHLYDQDDGLDADDLIGSKSIDPLDNYRDDNATGFTWTIYGSNEVKLRVTGTWIY